MEQKTVTAKSATHLAELVLDAISRNRIPVIVADQPAIAAIVVDNLDNQLSVNKLLNDLGIGRHLHDAIEFKEVERRVGHVVLMKASKNGAGAFDGAHFVKIVSNRLNVTMGSLANYLVMVA